MSLGEKLVKAICDKFGHKVIKDKCGCSRCKRCGTVGSKCK